MPRRTELNFPSYRNLLIYHEVAYSSRTQADVATSVGVSQVYVSKVCRQVKLWVDSLVEPRYYRRQPGNRFHLAIARERIRLIDAYEPVVAMFTGAGGDPRYLRRYIAVVNGQPLQTVEISEKPDFRLLNKAVDVAGRLAQLEAIAKLGPFAEIPNHVQQTIVHQYVRARQKA